MCHYSIILQYYNSLFKYHFVSVDTHFDDFFKVTIYYHFIALTFQYVRVSLY